MSQSGSFRQAGPIPPGTDIQTITGNTGGAVPPTLGNVFLINANTTVNIAGNPGISTLLQDFGLSNLILGSDALGITIGAQNVGLGLNALNSLTTGLSNVAIGFHALQSNTTGSANTAVGESALAANTTGTHNVAIGTSALELATTATENVAVGSSSLEVVTTGDGNVAVGFEAGQLITTGLHNNAIGNNALNALTTGNTNIAIGLNAGSAYTTESDNILIGNIAGTVADAGVIRIGSSPPISSCFIAGIYNEPVGGVNAIVFIDNTGKLGTVGGASLTITFQADVGAATPAGGILNINGAHNINTSAAGNTVTIAVNNTATLGDLVVITAGNPSLTLSSGDLTLSGVGLNAAGNINLPNPTDNTGRLGVINIGANTLLHTGNSVAASNIFLGRDAGNFTQTGIDNTGIGFNALAALTTGSFNTSIGGGLSGGNITTGDFNTAVGNASLLSLTTGSNNTSLGTFSLNNIVTGSNNIAIGLSAGTNYTGAETDNILIGNQGILGDNNIIRIGTDLTHTSAFMAGVYNQPVGAINAAVFIDNTGKLGTNPVGAAVQTLTGNTGGPIAPAAGNINIVTANSTPIFAGAGSTLTLDFDLTTNLLLGSNGGAITTANDNTAVGHDALLSVTTGDNNSALGSLALTTCLTGFSNTAIGFSALTNLTSGSNNSGLGISTLLGVTTGTNNTACGSSALNQLITGSSNIAVGNLAGTNYTGAESNNIVIGNQGTLGDSATIRVGTNATHTSAFMAGVANVVVANQEMVVINTVTGQLGSEPIPGGGLLEATLVLTSPQVKNLQGTPITFIPAQGVGTLIRIVTVVGKLNYGGTNPFDTSAGQNIGLYYNSVAGQHIQNALDSASIAQTQDFYGILEPVSFLAAASALENLPIVVSIDKVTEISGNAANDNTITIEALYQILTL